MGSVLVIGSSNTDLVVRVTDLPRPGETILGSDFQTFDGGKGANQAVAAKRAGANVTFIAAIGDDDFGKSAINAFKREGIDTTAIEIISGIPSGVAMIVVNEAGENSIAVAPGANEELLADSLAAHADAFTESDILLLQLETPLQTVSAAVGMATANSVPVILNPAPAQPLPDSVLDGLFCLTPNESELELLSGRALNDDAAVEAAADDLLRKGVQNVIVTRGAKGAMLRSASGSHFQAATAVTVVDTTGAGDTFNGVLAAMLSDRASLTQAMAVAIDAASISVQTAGAIASIPHLSA